MKKALFAVLMLLSMATLAVSLVACGGGSSASTSTIVSGVASQGAVFAKGTEVSLRDAKGTVKPSAVTDEKGSYSIIVDGLVAPFIIKVGTLYSFAEGAGTVNINPFTNVAVQNSAGTDPATVFAQADATKLAAGLQTIKAKLKSEVETLKAKLDPLYPGDTTIEKDFLNGKVVSLSKSYDKLFDSIKVIVDGSGKVIMTQTGQTTPFMTVTSSTSGPAVYVVDDGQRTKLSGTLATVFTPVDGGGTATTPTTPTTPLPNSSSPLTLTGAINSSLTLNNSTIYNSGPVSVLDISYGMINSTKSAIYKSVNDYERGWSSGDTLFGLSISEDTITHTMLLSFDGKKGTTSYSLGGYCVASSGQTPSCASIGIKVNRSAGSISFTSTPMLMGDQNASLPSGSFTVNGTLTFTPF